MPMIETTTIRCTPACSPSRCRFPAEAVKNAVASCWSGDGLVAVSITVSTSVSASASPSPVTTSTPSEREIETTSRSRSSSTSTTWRPSLPVAPTTANFPVSLITVSFPFACPFCGDDERGAVESTSAAAELAEVELGKPFRVGEEVDLEDLAVLHGDGCDGERLPVKEGDHSGGAVDECTLHGQVDARPHQRLAGDGLRAADVLGQAAEAAAVGPKHDIGVECGDE